MTNQQAVDFLVTMTKVYSKVKQPKVTKNLLDLYGMFHTMIKKISDQESEMINIAALAAAAEAKVTSLQSLLDHANIDLKSASDATASQIATLNSQIVDLQKTISGLQGGQLLDSAGATELLKLATQLGVDPTTGAPLTPIT